MKNRVEMISEILNEHSVDAIFLTNPSNIYYLTGIQFQTSSHDGYCLVISGKIFVFTNALYIGSLRSKNKITVVEIAGLAHLFTTLTKIVRHNRVEKIGFEKENILHHEFTLLKKSLKKTKLIPINNPLASARLHKSTDEVRSIKRACKVLDLAFKHILKYIKLGVSEKELASEIGYFIKKRGADLAFPPIVAFGKNSAIPHHSPTTYKLKPKNIVLLDFGARVNGYCSDITRTVYFGNPSQKIKNIYQTVLDSQLKVLDHMYNKLVYYTSELETSSLDKVARNHITKAGYPSIPHSLGHGIGLDIHESPRIGPNSRDVLNEGMVFTIEPGIYLPRIGGIRIEDTVLITNKGIEVLTKSPKNLIFIPL